MFRRKFNIIAPVLVIAFATILIFLYQHINTNDQDTRKDIEELHQQMEKLQQEIDSLKLVSQQFRNKVRGSEYLLGQSIYQLDLNQAELLGLLESIIQEAEDFEKQASSLQKKVSESQAGLQLSFEKLRSMLQNNQDNLRDIQPQTRRNAPGFISREFQKEARNPKLVFQYQRRVNASE